MPPLSLWPPASPEPDKGFGFINQIHLCGPRSYVSPSLADTPFAAVSIFLLLGPDLVIQPTSLLLFPDLNPSSALH